MSNNNEIVVKKSPSCFPNGINPSIHVKQALARFFKIILSDEFELSVNDVYFDAIGLEIDPYRADKMVNGFFSSEFEFQEINSKLMSTEFGTFFDVACHSVVETKHPYFDLDEQGKMIASWLTGIIHEYHYCEDSIAVELLSRMTRKKLIAYCPQKSGINGYEAVMMFKDENDIEHQYMISELVVMAITDSGIMPVRTHEQKLNEWLLFGDTGQSSKAMAAASIGRLERGSYPHDLSDLNRCMKLLQEVPEVRESIPLMTTLNPEWKGLSENWEELEGLFYEELGLDNICREKGKNTYALLKKLTELN